MRIRRCLECEIEKKGDLSKRVVVFTCIWLKGIGSGVSSDFAWEGGQGKTAKIYIQG